MAFVSCAGGLNAIRTVLADLPSDCGMAFILIQHLDSARRSAIPDFRSRPTRFPVLEVFSRIARQRNHVYVVPLNKGATIRNGTLFLEPITGRNTHQAIDDLMADPVATPGDAVTGIVYSDTGSARRVIQTRGVDFVLPPARIALALGRLARSVFKLPGPGFAGPAANQKLETAIAIHG